jgi:adenosine deaminase
MSRTAPALIVERQEEVAEMLIKGKRTKDIVSYMHTKYNVSQVTVERDVTEAYKWIKQYITRNVDDVIAMHISRYESIYDKAMDMYDFKSAIAALRAVEDILKIRENQPLVTVNQNTINIDGLSTQEIKEILSSGSKQA